MSMLLKQTNSLNKSILCRSVPIYIYLLKQQMSLFHTRLYEIDKNDGVLQILVVFQQ